MTGSYEAEPGFAWESSKTYTHAQGLSCCFRQWRANHSHCQYLHGYALQIKLTFQCDELDSRYWCRDFGGLKGIKKWLEDTFDHMTVVAEDDPQISIFRELEIAGLIQLKVVPDVGCEKFAQYIFHNAEAILSKGGRYAQDGFDARLMSVEVREHEGNSATYKRLA